jgi:hypothetical protein
MWFGLLGAMFANRDMCFGGPHQVGPGDPKALDPKDASTNAPDARLYFNQAPTEVAS